MQRSPAEFAKSTLRSINLAAVATGAGQDGAAGIAIIGIPVIGTTTLSASHGVDPDPMPSVAIKK
jgi:hypothetical protein